VAQHFRLLNEQQVHSLLPMQDLRLTDDQRRRLTDASS